MTGDSRVLDLPQAGDVRWWWIEGRSEHVTTDQAGDQFDRWLAEHDATVLESARNRLNGHDPAGEQLQRMADEKRNAGREDER